MSYFNVRLIAPSVAATLALGAALILPGGALASGTTTTAKTTRTAVSGGASMGASSGTSTSRSTSSSRKRSHHRAKASAGDSKHLGDRTLRPGMSGHDVRVLQSYLTIVGYPTTVDGVFGPTTKAHVIAFQRANHFTPNGVVTRAVELKLRALVAAASRSRSGPVGHATISHGLAVAPSNAPTVIKEVIAAANKIAFKPYIYGGGHASWNDSGYDCSGSVSYALHGGGLLSSPEDSTELESYGRAGGGRWISIWANSGHVYMYVAGLRFDTSAQSQTGGSRWTSQGRSNSGFVERHPSGL